MQAVPAELVDRSCDRLARAVAHGMDFNAEIAPALSSHIHALLKDGVRLHARRNAAGFLYVQLTFDERRPTSALRLHFWPAEEPRSPSIPHTHSCHLQSVIICGELENVEYRLLPGDGFAVREAFCEAEYCTHTPRYQQSGCKTVGSKTYFAGDRYSVEHDVFHSTHVRPNIFTATCVLMTDFRSVPSRLVDTGEKRLSGRLEKEVVSQRTVESLLRRTLTSL